MAIINYYESTKSYTALILSLFDQITLARSGDNYTVPVRFANKSRLFKHLEYKSRESRSLYSHLVPIMSLEFSGMDINLERQTNKLLKKGWVHYYNETTGAYEQSIITWNDTSVDFNFRLNIVGNTITELMQITEYIISMFKNTLYYVDYKSPIYDRTISTPIVLNSTEVELDNNEDMYEDDRLISTSLDFTVKGIIHNNIRPITGRINDIEFNLDYYDKEVEYRMEQYLIDEEDL